MDSLYEKLLQYGLDPISAEKALAYRDAFDGDVGVFVEVVSMFIAHGDAADLANAVGSINTPQVISNHTGYDYKGSENYEHENKGGRMNYSGVEDDVNTAIAEHEGWKDEYDY